MYSTVRTAVLDGINAIPVQVEVDISTGMPVFDMVGNLTPEAREAKERVKTALHNCGIALPAKRITVNLSPANIRKAGTGFDLPIAVAIMIAMG
ncbi:magnesium chelatase domain-containing protein, partial [Agathobacter rectalis]|uniref:magnesium chelatase domain-containing protein n=2 Tax=Agathobacter TaxID=1766253 RepID=UPI0027F7D82F|nr:magnesium chelatase [Agathobacter rectalis]